LEGCKLLTDEHNDVEHRIITIISYSYISLKLMHEVCTFLQSKTGQVVIPASFKVDKSIIAVCDGAVALIDKFGNRI
jgi:hypothetical protein